MSDQAKKIEGEQFELLKTFEQHLSDVKIFLAQNKTVSAETAYLCFLGMHEKPDEKRLMQHLKLKYMWNLDNKTER